MNPPLSPKECERTAAAFKQALAEGYPVFGTRHSRGAGWRVAEILEISVSTAKSRLAPNGGFFRATGIVLDEGPFPDEVFEETMARRRAELGELGTAPVLPGFVIKSTSTQRGFDGETQREWVRTAKEPGEVFELPENQRVKGVSALLGPDGRVLQRWVKTREDVPVESVIDAARAAFAEYEGRALPAAPPAATNDDLLSVYPIADQHLGLLSWGRETGESYDLKIGCERLRDCMGRLVAQSPPSKQALVLNLGDWTHQDDSRNVTPRSGHVLDVDGRYGAVLKAGVRLLMDCVDAALARHETVLLRNLPGNHDPHASYALTIALACFYARDERVTVDDSPSEWFFHRFGEVLIGAHHGHRAKPEAMAMTMACQQREAWGATRWKVIYAGHVHHETAKEVGDVRCETFQSLAGRDAYAAGAGFSSGRSLTSITWHRTDGEIGRHRVNVPR